MNEYESRRDFSLTPEPAGEELTESRQGPLIFCIQKHNAHKLHYDLRLESAGVLKSWAVPEGPSLNPEIRRLAVQVEDHPLEYANFEGVIPKNQYGAGEVIVWDRGEYFPLKNGKKYSQRPEAEKIINTAVDSGRVSFFLNGQKLKGAFALAHMKDKNWLLIKRRDEFAREQPDILEEQRSVISGLAIEEMKPGPAGKVNIDKVPGAQPSPMPRKVAPMLAMLAEEPFSNPEWIFEPKMDGIRAIAILNDGKVKLLSRRQNDISRQYPAIVRTLEKLPVKEAVLDGEICALDERGRPSFQKLQSRINLVNRDDIRQAERKIPAYYFIFDLLYYNGHDVRNAELLHRKEVLSNAFSTGGVLTLLDYFTGDGELVYAEATGYGFEGIIAKKLDSLYQEGVRSRQWLKIKKITSEDFVIAGYTGGKGSRAKTFGSLLLGYYNKSGELLYAGNVGTGFDEASQQALKLQLDKIKSARSPFLETPAIREPVTWIKPEMVSEVKFLEWTQDGRLRSPVFLRLRPDKSPGDVHLTGDVPSITPPTENKNKTPDVEAVLDQLQNSADSLRIEINGSILNLSNLNKEFWSATEQTPAQTKRDLLVYLANVSTPLLNHLHNRPLTLNRYPDGIDGENFYQKQWNDPLPDFVQTVNLPTEHSSRDTIDYILCNNLATLLWLGQIADLELHTWFSRVVPEPDMTLEPEAENNISELVQYPDFVIFDIDPYIYSGKEAPRDEPQLNREAFERTKDAAMWLKEQLDTVSLRSFVKTSGKTGLHIYVPVLRQYDYETTRSVAETVCNVVLRKHLRVITTDWSVEKRRGKIFLDFNQNVKGKTLAAPYSPRPVAGACVSTPLDWDELEHAYPTEYTMMTVPDRLEKKGDIWANILEQKNDLAGLLN